MSLNTPMVLALGAVVVGLAVILGGPLVTRMTVQDPEPGTRTGAMIWADRAGGVPMLGPDGTERRVARADLDGLRHGLCLRRFDTVYTPATSQGRERDLLLGVPIARARVMHLCRVSARHRPTGDFLRGVIRLVGDPRQPWVDQSMLSGPELPQALAAIGGP